MSVYVFHARQLKNVQSEEDFALKILSSVRLLAKKKLKMLYNVRPEACSS